MDTCIFMLTQTQLTCTLFCYRPESHYIFDNIRENNRHISENPESQYFQYKADEFNNDYFVYFSF
jgi:hypothetical protein